MKRSPYLDECVRRLHELFDMVDNDMRVYDFTGTMDIPMQDAALDAMGPLIDQAQAELRMSP